MQTKNTFKNEYEKQADDFLAKHGIGFHVEFVGSDCPNFCEDASKQIDMDKLNTFPRKTHIHGKHYRCFLNRQDGHRTKTVSFDFWNSYANEEEKFFAFGPDESLNNYVTGRDNCYWDKYRVNAKYPGIPRARANKLGVQQFDPSAYDLLACIEKNELGSFEEFATEYGYDTDSRKAEQTYHAVIEEYRKVKDFFTAEEIKELQEVQ